MTQKYLTAAQIQSDSINHFDHRGGHGLGKPDQGLPFILVFFASFIQPQWVYLSRIFRSDPQPLSSSSCFCSLSSCFFSLSSTSLSLAAVSTGLAAPKIDDALPPEVGAGAEKLPVPPLPPPLLLSSSLGTLRGLRFNFGLCWGAAVGTEKDKTKN